MSTDISPKWTCLAPSKAACAWPDCGCDPEATKVIAALVEQGWQAPKEVEAILARSSEQAAQGWQPIETAPKDGTTIDLWAAGNRIPDAYWGRPEHSCGEYGQHCDCCPDYDGWCDVFGYVTGSEGWSSKEPTHWVKRPIGPPVSGSAEGAK